MNLTKQNEFKPNSNQTNEFTFTRWILPSPLEKSEGLCAVLLYVVDIRAPTARENNLFIESMRAPKARAKIFDKYYEMTHNYYNEIP